jgi:NAD(P)-dependent dehydrogenase (short-subunit alcohol dehydrogenase family)
VAAAGGHVVLAARDREALDRVARPIREAGGRATPVPTGVSDEAEVERLGPLGALVCAAGVLTPAPSPKRRRHSGTRPSGST